MTEATHLQQAVRTQDNEGATVGFRIVDMYHPGTARWLQKHLWWASHNACKVVIETPTDGEVADYVTMMTQRLAAQFQSGPASADDQ